MLKIDYYLKYINKYAQRLAHLWVLGQIRFSTVPNMSEMIF